MDSKDTRFAVHTSLLWRSLHPAGSLRDWSSVSPSGWSRLRVPSRTRHTHELNTDTLRTTVLGSMVGTRTATQRRWRSPDGRCSGAGASPRHTVDWTSIFNPLESVTVTEPIGLKVFVSSIYVFTSVDGWRSLHPSTTDP